MEIIDGIPGTISLETRTYARTIKENKRKLKLLIECSNYIYNSLFKLQYIKPKYSNEELALLLIASKNFRTLCACYKFLLTGYYYEIYIMLRTLLDSYLLMVYLKTKPEQVKKWINGVEFKFGNMQDELKHEKYENLIPLLSNFVHTDYKAAINNIYKRNKKDKARFMTSPLYEKELFEEAYSGIIHSYVEFFSTIRYCFNDLLIKDKNKKWHRDLRKIILKINKKYS